jgi:ABC-type oligopeptide transport system ATPase subunit
MEKPNLNFCLQGKGGCGKSHIAASLIQYIQEKSGNVVGVDTDVSNRTLASIKFKSDVMSLELMQDNQISVSKFDDLIMFLLGLEEKEVVIDVGSNSFLPLVNYLLESDIINLILSNQYNIILHIPVVGGEAMPDTLNGLEQLIGAFKTSCTYVVYANEHFGKLTDKDGKSFEEMEAYIKNKKYIHGLVYLPKNPELITLAIEKMKKAKATFDGVLEDESFNILEKSRIGIVKNDIWSKLDLVLNQPTQFTKKK